MAVPPFILLTLLVISKPAAGLPDDRSLADRVREVLGGAPPAGPPGEMKVFPAIDLSSFAYGLGPERTPSMGLIGDPANVRGVHVGRGFSGKDGSHLSLDLTVMRTRAKAFDTLINRLTLSNMQADAILRGIEAGVVSGYGDRAVLRKRKGRTDLDFLRDNIVVRLEGGGAAAARVTALGRLIDDAIVREVPRPSLDFVGRERPLLQVTPRQARVGERFILRITGGETARERWRVRWAEDSKVTGRFEDGTYHWTAKEPGARELSGLVYDTRGRCGRVSVKVVVREAEPAVPKPAPEPVKTFPAPERVKRLRKEFDLDPGRKGRLKLFPLAILTRVPMLMEAPRLTLEPEPGGPEVKGTIEYRRSGEVHLLVRYEVWSSRKSAIDALLAASSEAPVSWKKLRARLRRIRTGRGDIGFEIGNSDARFADFVRDNIRVHVGGTGAYARVVVIVADVLDDHIRAGDEVSSLGFPNDAAPVLVPRSTPVVSGTGFPVLLEIPEGHRPQAFVLRWKGQGPHPEEVAPGVYRASFGEPGTRTLEARYMDSSGRIADLRTEIVVREE